jgi:hypothetical protein
MPRARRRPHRSLQMRSPLPGRRRGAQRHGSGPAFPEWSESGRTAEGCFWPWRGPREVSQRLARTGWVDQAAGNAWPRGRARGASEAAAAVPLGSRGEREGARARYPSKILTRTTSARARVVGLIPCCWWCARSPCVRAECWNASRRTVCALRLKLCRATQTTRAKKSTHSCAAAGHTLLRTLASHLFTAHVPPPIAPLAHRSNGLLLLLL